MLLSHVTKRSERHELISARLTLNKLILAHGNSHFFDAITAAKNDCRYKYQLFPLINKQSSIRNRLKKSL